MSFVLSDLVGLLAPSFENFYLTCRESHRDTPGPIGITSLHLIASPNRTYHDPPFAIHGSPSPPANNLINHFIYHNQSTITMSSYNSAYQSPPSSPSYGFFPAATASPHAFASFGQSPRDQHNMYASLGSSHGYPQQNSAQSTSQGASCGGIFAMFTGRK